MSAEKFRGIATARVFDFGSSGLRTAAFRVTQSGEIERLEAGFNLGHPDWQNLGVWIAERVAIHEDRLGFATAGFVDSERGVVWGWVPGPALEERPVRQMLEEEFGRPVSVLNDAEAHLLAELPALAHPACCLTLGGAVGFALTDAAGSLLRPRPASSFDLGEMPFRAGDVSSNVQRVLGTEGFRELEDRFGRGGAFQRYGQRLGSFMATLSTVFQPRTILLGGGILAHWERLRPATDEAFERERPFWLVDAAVLASRWPADGALWGIACHCLGTFLEV